MAPAWEGFLARVQPDQETRDFLRRAVGYSLTASTAERVIFIPYGVGANGKSVFLEAVRMLLGADYAAKTESSAVLTRKAGGSGGGYEPHFLDAGHVQGRTRGKLRCVHEPLTRQCREPRAGDPHTRRAGRPSRRRWLSA